MFTNKYKITQIIGEGASGTVYRAIDSASSIEVAIKILNPTEDNELQILKCINSENIVRLKNFYKAEKRLCLVLELCDYDLISFINNHYVDWKCVKKIMRMILLGIKFLHDHKIIHRDIKLGNILVKGGTIKICDFGLSCFEIDNDMRYCGTRDYLAPEMLILDGNKSLNYTNKIDVFAAGIILKILLTRKKEANIEELDYIDEASKDLLRNLLNNNPKHRFTADEALQHKYFEELFMKTEDFRLIKDFSAKTKYGIINRTDNYAEIIFFDKNAADDCLEKLSGINSFRLHISHPISLKSDSKSVDNEKFLQNKLRQSSNLEFNTKEYNKVIRIEYENMECNCKTFFNWKLFLNGKIAKKEYLNDTELKFYNYLLSYLALRKDKTVFITINGGDFTFDYFLTGTYKFSNSKITIIKSPVSEMFQINGKNMNRLPESYTQQIIKLDLHCKNLLKNKCICDKIIRSDSESNFSLSIQSDKLIKIYEFLERYGWCIKDGLKFTILLNYGLKYTLDAKNQTISYEGRAFAITKELDRNIIKLLRISLIFLKKYCS